MSSVSLFFAGDFCSKPSTTLISVSQELRECISSCDMKIVNFEVPLKLEGVRLPKYSRERFFQNDDAPDFLKGLGFNLFAGANNHAMDQGKEGWLKTKYAFGDELFGAGLYDDAYKVKIVECNGLKLGFMALSYAAHLGTFSSVMHKEGYGCAYIDDLRVNHEILNARQAVDFLFVLPHAGMEYIDVPLPEIRARYHDFIDYGADAVIGTHPHCPQGWEEYKGKPIFYSLGNFFFNSKSSPDYRATKPHWYEGLCVKMIVSENNMEYDVINVRNHENVSLSIDHDPSRDRHNDECRRYLYDNQVYESYLSPHIDRMITSMTRKVEHLYADDSILGTMKCFFKALIHLRTKRSSIDERDLHSAARALVQLKNNK